jgi:hypothetical protein
MRAIVITIVALVVAWIALEAYPAWKFVSLYTSALKDECPPYSVVDREPEFFNQFTDPTKWRPSREFETDSSTADGLVSLGFPRKVESVIRLYSLDPKTNSFWDRFYLNDHYRLTVLRTMAVSPSRKCVIYTDKAHIICVIENAPYMVTFFRQDGERVIEKLMVSLATWKHMHEGDSHVTTREPNHTPEPAPSAVH